MKSAVWSTVLVLAAAAACARFGWAQESALRADTPPGVCIFEAAKLWPSEIEAHKGKVVDDADATSGGKALQVPPYRRAYWDRREGVYFGFPAGAGPTGEVMAAFRMKISSVEEGVPTFYIAVADGGTYWPLTRELITPADFDGADTYGEFSIPFIRRPDRGYSAAIIWRDLGTADLTVDTVTLCPTGSPLGVGHVRPDRLWYRRGERATVAAAVSNNTPQAQQALLKAVVVAGLDSARTVLEQSLSLDAHEVRDLSFEFGVGSADWGREVKVCLFQGGKEVASASEVFTVGDNLYKVSGSQGYGPLAYRGREGGKGHYPIRDIYVPEYRLCYFPLIEVFSWSPGMSVAMVPQHESWLSGQGGYEEAITGLRTFVEECHKQGIGVVTYDQAAFYGPVGFDWARKNPHLLSYNALGRPNVWFDVAQLERQRDPEPPGWQPGTYGGGGLWVLNDELIDLIADQLIEASRMFGFDGVRWDGHPMVTGGYTVMPDQTVVTGAKLTDYSGRTFEVKDPDAETVRIMHRMNSRIRQALPRYMFGYNWGPTHERIWPEAMPETWKTFVRDAYILDEDLNTRGLAPDPNNTWEKFARRVVHSVEYVRPYGGYHYSGGIVQGGVTGRHIVALLYASGSRLCGNLHCAPESYMKFGLRYAELLFSNENVPVRRQVEKVARVSSPLETWWKDYVYRRQSDEDASLTVVHVINPPASAYMLGSNREPAPQNGVSVTCNAPSRDASCAGAWWLSPDSEPHCVRLEPTLEPGKATVTLPKLRYWSVAVFEWTRQAF